MISGKLFADHCKWVVDPRYPNRHVFDSTQASDGDWVFVNGDYLDTFRSLVPSIGFLFKRFHIIVHNSDRPFGQRELEKILPLSKQIYAINTTVYHPRLTTIPIGFVDRQLPFLSALHPLTQLEGDRPIEIYMNFTVQTNVQKRRECADIFETDPRVVIRTNLSVGEYYADLRQSKFVLCPEGTGIDTHRVYESILCGAIPVVLRNSLSHLYETLPVCILDKWTDPFYVPERKNFKVNVESYI